MKKILSITSFIVVLASTILADGGVVLKHSSNVDALSVFGGVVLKAVAAAFGGVVL